jgi:hypothetical protein
MLSGLDTHTVCCGTTKLVQSQQICPTDVSIQAAQWMATVVAKQQEKERSDACASFEDAYRAPRGRKPRGESADDDGKEGRHASPLRVPGLSEAIEAMERPLPPPRSSGLAVARPGTEMSERQFEDKLINIFAAAWATAYTLHHDETGQPMEVCLWLLRSNLKIGVLK